MDYLKALAPDELRICGNNGIKAVSGRRSLIKRLQSGRIWTRYVFRRRPAALFASQNEGLMHACGHDGHMAIALVCAKLVGRRGRVSIKIMSFYSSLRKRRSAGHSL